MPITLVSSITLINTYLGRISGSKKWESIHSKSEISLPYKTEHTAVLYKNCMYLFGGYSGSLGYRDTAIYEYNFGMFHILALVETK